MAWPRRGQVKGVGQNLLEFFRLGNDMVRGQHGHDAGGGTRADERRAERDGGAGVAAHGSAMTFCFGHLRQLFADFRRLDGIGDDENILERHERQHALDGLLEKGFFAEQGEQLLGRFLAAQRPEAFAACRRP